VVNNVDTIRRQRATVQLPPSIVYRRFNCHAARLELSRWDEVSSLRVASSTHTAVARSADDSDPVFDVSRDDSSPSGGGGRVMRSEGGASVGLNDASDV